MEGGRTDGSGKKMDKSKSNIRPPPQRKKKRDKSFQYPELFSPILPSFFSFSPFLPFLPAPVAADSKSFSLCSFRHTGKVHDGGGRGDTFEELANRLFHCNSVCVYAKHNLPVVESVLPNMFNPIQSYRRASCFATAAGERTSERD